MTGDGTNGANGSDWANRRTVLAGVTAVGIGGLGIGVLGTRGGVAEERTTVHIENVSTESTLSTTLDGDDAEQPVPLSPGAFAVHTEDVQLFAEGEPEGDTGIEEIAEDGMPDKLAETLAGLDGVRDSGAFTTPVGADEPAPIGPGGAYEFSADAEPGDRLSFATMFVPSNDLFYAPAPSGIALFGDDEATSGDVTDEVALWDAGTEINEEPGVGENQVQRQRGAGVGLVERGTIANIEDVNGYEYPAVSEVVRVTLTPE